MRVRLREKSSTSSATLAGVADNITLTATAYEQGWYQVLYEDLQGWIRADLLIASGDCGKREIL